MTTWHLSNSSMSLMENHPSEHAKRFGERKAYPHMERYQQLLKEHKERKEKEAAMANYTNRLQRFFEAHYGQYEDSAEWYGDPAPNQWKFRIPELKVVVTLTCEDNGHIVEEKKYGKN